MLKKLIDFFFPIICVWCEREGNYLCKECKKSLQAHPDLCPVCHRKSPSWNLCLGCKDELPWIDGISIAFVYEKLIKKLILDLKFHHRYQTGQYLGEKLALLIASDPFFDAKTTLVTHTPSHRWRKHIEKWYNQSQILADTVAQILHIPHLPLTIKTRHTRSQIKLSRTKRKTNLTDVFTYNLKQNIPKHIQTILIIDDIVTTGSTLHEIGCILRLQNPTLRIRWVVVARNAS
jgi:ComF family protein